jgi:hypothetical protein
MNCQEARRWISPYLDSELGHTKTFEVSEHLSVCDACRRRFEQERFVDLLLTERLREVPAMDWEGIEQQALRPRRVMFRVGLSTLALAACVVFAVVLWRGFLGPPNVADEWVVDAYRQAAPNHAAFQADEAVEEIKLASLTRETLGFDVTMLPQTGPGKHHVRKLIAVNERRLADGTPYIEVQLNCCGRPVLLVLARQSDASRFGRVAKLARPDSASYAQGAGNMKVAAQTDGELLVLAASQHPLEKLVTGFQRVRG